MTRPFQCHEETDNAMKCVEVMLSECDREEAVLELQGLRRWVDNLIAEMVKTKEMEHAV